MERYAKRIICICLCILIVALNIKIARAESLPDVMYGSATVADCVMSYYAMSGAAVANTDWINTLYNDLGSNFGTIYDFAENGMLTLNSDGTWQATSALETAIENAPAYQSLGLDQVFNVTSAEAAAGGGLAAASGGSILGGALGCTASVGVLPLLGGVTAAYWGGIAVGTLINHIINQFGKNIYNCSPVTDEMIKNIVPGGYSSYAVSTYNASNETWYNTVYYTNLGRIKNVLVVNSNNIGILHPILYNPNLANGNYRIKRRINGGSETNVNFGYVSGGVGYSTNSLGDVDNFGTGVIVTPNYTVISNIDDYVNAIRNGENIDFLSPDIIGPDGNQQGEYDSESGKYQVPHMLPQIDPSVQSGQPLTLQDWLRFANSAKGNNSDPAGKTQNKRLYDDIMDAIKKAIPSIPNPNPDQYSPPNPTPSPDPDYDPNPDNPSQPDYESEREGQSEPVPDSVPTGAPWITDGLLDKFPFCIPKDMIDMVKNFSSGTRQAPYISWRFNPPNTPVDYTFNLDLSDFEEIATLLRLLELGVFIVGLAFATRYLIGAT